MARRLSRWLRRAVWVVGACPTMAVFASASTTGQSGLIHMPDARVEPDGVWRFGVSAFDPYLTGWSSLTVSPRFEFSGRFTRIDDVPGFADNADYGAYKDKAFDAKAILWREREYLPAFAVGVQDFTGTRLFNARYAAFSKKWRDVDVTLGYGADRIDGVFGGVRYVPSAYPAFGVLLEYDANRYAQDYQAGLSGADRREGKLTYGIEYRFGWVTTQVSVQDGQVGGNAYVSVPLTRREFVPKLEEPAPPAVTRSGATLAQWGENRAGARALVAQLRAHGFASVLVQIDNDRLQLSVTHPRISTMGRAVGRAARIALSAGPEDIKQLEITYTRDDIPLITYVFSDPALLRAYFLGEADEAALRESVSIEADQPITDLAPAELTLAEPASPATIMNYRDDGHPLSIERRDAFLSGFSLVPFNLRIFFNDPSGAFRYDTFATLNYDRRLAPGWFLAGAARLTWAEDVSDVTQVSNSTLPHVRSDIVEYRREGDRLRLESLLVNRYRRLDESWFMRGSLGYYEEMYAGTGTQIVYLPRERVWAADVAIDALRQRAPGDSFGFRAYRTVTALGSVHLRLPRGIVLTARVGRFLARDEGVRMEFRRRFRSGVEMGAWYTVTNDDDITGPGREGDPYRDKGLFVSIPLNTLLTRDTRRRAELSLVDFTRDVGQMVRSPNDLYLQLEREFELMDPQTHVLTQFDK